LAQTCLFNVHRDQLTVVMVAHLYKKVYVTYVKKCIQNRKHSYLNLSNLLSVVNFAYMVANAFEVVSMATVQIHFLRHTAFCTIYISFA